MSNNPSSTLARPMKVNFCYAAHPRQPMLICDRANNHIGHCCNKRARESWDLRGRPSGCRQRHDHSTEHQATT
jgi:hypothetical protein